MTKQTDSGADSATLTEITNFARALARAGGRIAMLHYGQANPQLKFDESLVTEADLAVQAHVKQEVSRRFPEHRFLGEETNITEGPEEGAYLWVVDPVDGTSCFSKGYPVWGVSIAVLHNQKPLLGVFHMPVTGELYSAQIGQKPICDDQIISARTDEVVDNESLMLTYSRFHTDFTTTFPGKVRSLGSTVAHICYVARGAAWGAILGNIHIWDVVAGQAILEAAGGEIRDLDGELFEPSQYLEETRVDKVLMAAAKGQHRHVRSYITER